MHRPPRAHIAPQVHPPLPTQPTQGGSRAPAVPYESNIPAIPPAGNHSMSTFNDHSITSAAYASVRSVLKQAPRFKSIRGNLRRETEDEDQQRNCYHDPGLFIRGKLYLNRPLGLMVDNTRRVIIPPVPNLIASPGLVTRMSRRLATTPWTETAKATYRIVINFHKRTNNRGYTIRGGHTGCCCPCWGGSLPDKFACTAMGYPRGPTYHSQSTHLAFFRQWEFGQQVSYYTKWVAKGIIGSRSHRLALIRA